MHTKASDLCGGRVAVNAYLVFAVAIASRRSSRHLLLRMRWRCLDWGVICMGKDGRKSEYKKALGFTMFVDFKAMPLNPFRLQLSRGSVSGRILYSSMADEVGHR